MTHQGTDYPWRATIDKHELASAIGRIVQDIDYANFKGEVTDNLGEGRANRYMKIWSARYDMPEDLSEPIMDGFEGLPWPGTAPSGKAMAYGGVVVDSHGNFLLREVKNHFDGYGWTYAKGRPNKGESPRDTALREVLEEMGVAATIMAPIPGELIGGATINRFFLMVINRKDGCLEFDSDETSGLC
jgi:hypothetical protein